MHVHLDLHEAGHDGPGIEKRLKEAGFARGAVLSPGYHNVEGCTEARCDGQRDFTSRANDWTLEQTTDADSLVPFCGVPIGYEWAADEVARCAEAGGRGLKLHTGRDWLTLTDDATVQSLTNIIRTAAKHELVVLIHVEFEQPEVLALYDIAREATHARIIVAHQLGPALPLLLQAPDNVWTEVSGLLHINAEQRASLVPLWQAFGVRRILLGSDWPLREPADYLDALAQMPLSDKERRQIVRDNFNSLF